MRTLLTILFTVLFSAFVTCDLSVYYPANEKISSETVKCVLDADFVNPFVRVFTSSGKTDPYLKENLDTIHYGGNDVIDAIMMPCLLCNPKEQAITVMSLIESYSYIEGVWIDIDVEGWKEPGFNRVFLETIMKEFKRNGITFGILAAKNRWEQIFGADYSNSLTNFLVYRSLNKEPNFNDFKPFGGWRSPNGKHYDANGDVCSKKMDLIYQEA